MRRDEAWAGAYTPPGIGPETQAVRLVAAGLKVYKASHESGWHDGKTSRQYLENDFGRRFGEAFAEEPRKEGLRHRV